MDGDVGLGPGFRRVLALGIPLRPEQHDGPPGLGGLALLEEATARAREVSTAFSCFDYADWPEPGEGGDLADEVLRALKSQDTGVLVVHIVAHGELSGGGERGLHVIGSDRQAFDDSVSAWINLIESYPGKPRPLTLFILDLCYSGAAAVLPWHQEMPTEQRRAWVIAATGRDSLAFDYRLSRATAAVLGRYRDGVLRVDPSFEYIPLGEVAQEIKREVAVLSAGDYPQSVEISRVPLGEKPDHLRFFRNPGYQPSGASALSWVDDGMAPMLDEAFDPRHFMARGAGTEAVGFGLGQGYFRGRDDEVGVLARWFNGQGPAFRVVTGKPGVGKSALLGVLVCAAHPGLRGRTQPLWSSLSEKPARNDRLAVVHARRRSLEEIADSLARQMGADEADRPASGWDAEYLAQLATAGPRVPFTLVIDALDEADEPQDVTQALLIPLAQTAGRHPGAAVRLLIGTRPEPRFARLLDLARAADGLIDLDQAEPHQVRHALRVYLADLLATTGYASLDTYAAGQALAEAIAHSLTGMDDPAGPPGSRPPLGWGEFLVAGLYLRHILSQPAEPDPARARELGLAVPLDLPGLLELDLARRGDQPWLRPVLAALAHAEGLGMPERVIEHVAARLSPAGQPGGTAVPPQELRKALRQARFYLRRDIDTNATTLYRLFHEGLAEHLRTDPHGSPDGAPGVSTPGGSPFALPVYEGLLQSVPAAATGQPAWHVADPYLLRHATQHARTAGKIDDLLQDPEFLIHGDPEAVNAALAAAQAPRAVLAAAVYRASYGVHRDLRPEQRRLILAIDAARFQATEFSRQLARWADWQPAWATGAQVSAALIATLTGHTSSVTGVATATVGGRPVAITASRDGTARVWDLTTGQATATLTGHTGNVTGVATATVGGRPAAITVGDDTARVWDLTTGQATATLTGHTSYVTAVATATLDGRPVAVTTSLDRTARVWDPATGQATATLTGHTTGVTGVATATLDGRPVAVTTSHDDTAQVWDLTTGQATATLTGHTSSVTGVATATLGGRPVAVTTSWDDTARVWDLTTGQAIGTLTGHTNDVTAVATATLDGRLIAVTTSDDRTARVWDLTTGQATATLTSHTSGVTGVATVTLGGRPVAVTTSHDDTARVWDLTTGQATATLTGHTQRVTAVATATLGGRPVAVTTSRDRTARVWDLTTGQATATLTGHTEYVTGVATVTLGGRPVAVTTSHDDTARVWDLTTGQATATLTGHTEYVTAVATATLGGHPVAITTSRDRTARVWDLTTGQATATLTGHTSYVTAVATATLGGHPVAITTSHDDTARVWDLTTGQATATLTGHTSYVTAVATATLGGHPVAITTSWDDTARVWDLTTGQATATLTGHTKYVTAVATATLDGRLIAVTTSDDRTARVWDLATAACQATLTFPDAPGAAAIAADGTIVLGMGHEVITLSPPSAMRLP